MITNDMVLCGPVLNALRAHDDRFNATVNKIELNKKKPNNILLARSKYGFDEYDNPINLDGSRSEDKEGEEFGKQLSLQF